VYCPGLDLDGTLVNPIGNLSEQCVPNFAKIPSSRFPDFCRISFPSARKRQEIIPVLVSSVQTMPTFQACKVLEYTSTTFSRGAGLLSLLALDGLLCKLTDAVGAFAIGDEPPALRQC
jgi:hypothetical protein